MNNLNNNSKRRQKRRQKACKPVGSSGKYSSSINRLANAYSYISDTVKASTQQNWGK